MIKRINKIIEFMSECIRFTKYYLKVTYTYWSRRLLRKKYNLGDTVHFMYEGSLRTGDIYMMPWLSQETFFVRFPVHVLNVSIQRTGLVQASAFIDMEDVMKDNMAELEDI